jgi:glyoxylase-like metal-dependent hydrolase (beta-lactamase superfamily II)
LRFWGVRGSVPWAIPAAIGHGCNTPCLEITDDETGQTLVIDAGSGIVGLGPALTGTPRELPILLTHYHWDHLQGLPFSRSSTSRAGGRGFSRPSSRTRTPTGWKSCFDPRSFRCVLNISRINPTSR